MSAIPEDEIPVLGSQSPDIPDLPDPVVPLDTPDDVTTKTSDVTPDTTDLTSGGTDTTSGTTANSADDVTKLPSEATPLTTGSRRLSYTTTTSGEEKKSPSVDEVYEGLDTLGVPGGADNSRTFPKLRRISRRVNNSWQRVADTARSRRETLSR